MVRTEFSEAYVGLEDQAAFEAPARLLQERVVLRRRHARLGCTAGELGKDFAEGLDVYAAARRQERLHRFRTGAELAQALEPMLVLDVEA